MITITIKIKEGSSGYTSATIHAEGTESSTLSEDAVHGIIINALQNSGPIASVGANGNTEGFKEQVRQVNRRYGIE